MTEHDSRALASFLGERPLIQTLKDRRPKLTGATMEESFGSAKFAEGWEACVTEIIKLSQLSPQNDQDDNFVDTSPLDR